MAEPFIKLYKKMLKWEWYDDANTMRLFIHCLLKANWEKTSWHGVDLNPGQFITSLPSLVRETKLTTQQVRTAIQHLESTGEITSNPQAGYRIITVNSWSEYQGNNRQPNSQVTGEQQASNRRVTAVKEYKEIKEEKELKEYKNIYFPTDDKLNEAFVKYVAMRKKIKKPMSDDAVTLAIGKLEKLSSGDNDLAIRILEQSIFYSWQGLFPLKDDYQKSQSIDWSKV